MIGKSRFALAVSAILLVLSAVFAGSALAAAPVTVQAASALDATHVKITFNRAVDTSAANTARYSVSPTLAVTAVTLTDLNYSAVLTTATQTNTTAYTVTVSGISGMRSSQQVRFVGTYLGPNDAKTTFEDDFNRPSGLLLTDSPIPGPWTNLNLTVGNTIELRPAPASTPAVAWSGTNALCSRDTPLDPDNDNADVQARVSGNDLYYSAYIYVPRQSWPAGTEVGLLRLDTAPNTAHASLYAVAQSFSAYSLGVNWKNPTGAYNATGSTAATGVSFNQWHWLQMHVRNGAPGTGEVQIFLDGKLVFQNSAIGVYAIKMIYAEAGIMHMTPGATATTYTDQLRFGGVYTLPSIKSDTTAPTNVTLTTSATQIHDPALLTATARDTVGVQRVDFLLDGQVAASSDYAADYHWTGSAYAGTYSLSYVPLQNSGIADGTHQLTARTYDTSGNSTTTSPITVTIDSSGPHLLSPAASPNPFTPNGDGSQDSTHVTFKTTQTASYTVQVFNGATLVKTLKSVTDVAAGPQSSSWDGTYWDAASASNLPVADGTYTARITVSDAYGRTTVADVPVTVDRTLAAFTRTPSGISPLSASSSLNHTTGTYSLLADANVGVTVADANGTTVRTVQAPGTAETGNATTPVVYQFTWDGRDDSATVVSDGSYTLRVTATNAVGTVSLAKTVTVDSTGPTITIDSVTPLTAAAPYPTWTPATDGVLSVAFTVNEPGGGDVKFTLGGVTQRTITVSIPSAGQYTVTWDGTLNDLTTPAAAGDYRVKIYFSDKVGNHATAYPVQSDVFTLVR
jgi:flagellar hook assembly protein FlgD